VPRRNLSKNSAPPPRPWSRCSLELFLSSTGHGERQRLWEPVREREQAQHFHSGYDLGHGIGYGIDL
jgi:hypothetical protein